MIRIFKTVDGKIHQVDEASEGCWLALTDPTATEIFEIARRYHIEVDDLRAPLDEEERSRIEVEDEYTLIIVDTPILEERGEKDWYGTIPLSIIVTDEIIITVCLEDTSVLSRFMDGRVRNFYTYMKTRFILQILYKNASMFLHYLRIIDKKSEEVEEKLQESTKNQELIEQAIEMANIYSGILSGMTEAFASIVSNNLNIVMKFLATVTIVMSIPTMIFSAYGMNLNAKGMPFAGHPEGFAIVIVLSLLLSLIVAFIFSKKNLF